MRNEVTDNQKSLSDNSEGLWKGLCGRIGGNFVIWIILGILVFFYRSTLDSIFSESILIAFITFLSIQFYFHTFLNCYCRKRIQSKQYVKQIIDYILDSIVISALSFVLSFIIQAVVEIWARSEELLVLFKGLCGLSLLSFIFFGGMYFVIYYLGHQINLIENKNHQGIKCLENQKGKCICKHIGINVFAILFISGLVISMHFAFKENELKQEILKVCQFDKNNPNQIICSESKYSIFVTKENSK